MKEITLGKIKLGKKQIIIIACVLAVIIIAAVIIAAASAGKKAYRSIRVIQVEGSVMTYKDDLEYLAYPNMVISGGTALATENESFTRMTLDENKYVRLDEKSRAVFSAAGGKSKRTVIDVTEGSLVSEITSPLEDGEEFVINTPNAVMAVRGTMFRTQVATDKDGNLHTYVYTFGGAVSCKKDFGGEELVVPAGRMADIYEYGSLREAETEEITLESVRDDDLIDIYRASENGHELFASSEEIKEELEARGTEVFTYELEGTCNPSYADDTGGGIYEVKAGGIAGESVYRAALRADSCGEKLGVDVDGDGINISPDYIEMTGSLFLAEGKYFEISAAGRARIDGSGARAELFCGSCTMMNAFDSKTCEEKKYRLVSASFYSEALKINTPSDMKVKIIVAVRK